MLDANHKASDDEFFDFEAALESLRGHVRAADFVAIDLEMTGVASAPWRESLEFDRHNVRYLKVKDSAEKFAVVQFGVCPFRWDPEKLCFIANPHNFYVFHRKELSVHCPSSEFLCQTSSIDFLAKYQFDFNESIREDQVEALVNMRSIPSKCQNKIQSDDTAGDDSRRDLSVDEIVDSFYVPEVEQIRTSHL